MTASTELHDDLHDLVDQLLAGELSTEDRTKLNGLLRGSDEHCVAYLRHLAVHASLSFDAQEATVGHAPRDKSTEPAGPVGHALHDKNSGSEHLDPGRGASPTTRKTLLKWASRHPKGPAVAIAATILIAALVVMGLTPVKDWMAGGGKAKSEEREPGSKQDFVARLSNWKNDVWLDDTRPPLDDPRLNIGSRLKIESGFIELTYLTGARVVIEGPAEFYVGRKDEGGRMKDESYKGHPSSFIPHPSNSGYLALGKLVARVEGEKAQGFTINTPSARVEDLGTEFGVEVNKEGASEVYVLDGEVDLVRGDSDERMRLVANQGASVDSSGRRFTRRAVIDPEVVAALKERIRQTFEPVASPGTVALIDFGRADNASGATYNNVGFLGERGDGVTSGRIALRDVSGRAIGWAIKVTEDGDNNGGVTSSKADVDVAPEALSTFERVAWQDGLFANGSSSRLTVSISGLDDDLAYDLLFYGSRSNGQSCVQTWHITEGVGGSDVIHESGLNATTAVHWRGVRTNGNGHIAFEITGGTAIALNFGSITLPSVAESKTEDKTSLSQENPFQPEAEEGDHVSLSNSQ